MQIDYLKKILKDNNIELDTMLLEECSSEEEDEILATAGIPFTFVTELGHAESSRWVFKFGDNFYEARGYSDSWDVSIDDVWDFYEVEPYEKTITCYRKKKNEG